MSYQKMMKWNKTHKKGTKSLYMGFNPSGITTNEIEAREAKYVKNLTDKGELHIEAERRQINLMKSKWQGSWPWEWCAFQRHFGLK